MAEQTLLDVVLRLKDELSGKLSGVTKGLQGMGSSLATVGKWAGVGLGALTAGIGAAGTMAVKSAADFEQTKIALTTMLGSADKAGSLLQDIAKFAAATPFEMPELATTTKQLIAFGFSGEEAFSNMKMLGEISSGVGVPMSQLAYVFGQVRVAGKLMGGDLMQFTNAGVPMISQLSKVLNVSEADVKDMVSAGKVGFPEVQKAIQQMTDEGGRFHGMMAAQSTTLSGLWSTLTDNIGGAMREMIGISLTGEVREGSIFDMLRKAAANLIAWIDANKENIIAFFTNLVTTIMNFGQQAWAYIQPVYNVLKQFFDDVENRKAAIIAVLAVLTIAFVAWGISVITSMAPITLAIAAIGAAVFVLSKAWNENWGGIQEKTRAVMEAIVGFYNEYIVPFWKEYKKRMDEALKVWKENWDAIKTIFQGVWQAIYGIFQVAWALLSGAVKVGIDIFTGNWSKAWEDVKKTFENVFKGIYNFGAGIFKSIIVALSSMVNGAVDLLNKLIDKMNKIPGVDIGKIGKVQPSDLMSYIPTLAVGTNYVPEDTLAYIHKGEAVVPKEFNPAAGGMGGGVVIQITGDNYFSGEADVDMLIDKIKIELSRDQERANWGIA
jgi:tape measure domain-containing protein